MAKECFVAVYGTLMKGEVNEHWRADVETVTEGAMIGWLFDTGFGFPAFVPDDGNDHLFTPATAVRCEVLRVTRSQLAHMDVLEGYPNLYRRENVVVHGADDNDYDCIVYVMNSMPAQAKFIRCGRWKDRRADEGA